MTKKLSKQLCDICDIPFERHIDNCRVVDNDGDLCEQYVEILDFGQPENFVKLFGIIVTMEDFIYETGHYTAFSKNKQFALLTDNFALDEFESTNLDPIKAFIECVIKCVKDDKDTADYIKEQEWGYG